MAGQPRGTTLSLFEAVATLEGTQEAIATLLRAAKIFGRMHDACHCPVARYIAWCMAEPEERVSVGQHHITYFDVYNWNWLRCETPHGVAHFIHEFDLGHYRDLVDVLTDSVV